MDPHDEDPASLDDSSSVLDAYAGPGQSYEGLAKRRLGQLRPVLVAVVAFTALMAAGVAIAAGLGGFNGISAAQGTQTGASVLPQAVLAQLKQMNARAAQANQAANNPSGFQRPYLLPDTARVLGKMPNGSPVYGLADTQGDLCTISEAGGGCGPPLTSAHPITMGGANPNLPHDRRHPHHQRCRHGWRHLRVIHGPRQGGDGAGQQQHLRL